MTADDPDGLGKKRQHITGRSSGDPARSRQSSNNSDQQQQQQRVASVSEYSLLPPHHEHICTVSPPQYTPRAADIFSAVEPSAPPPPEMMTSSHDEDADVGEGFVCACVATSSSSRRSPNCFRCDAVRPLAAAGSEAAAAEAEMPLHRCRTRTCSRCGGGQWRRAACDACTDVAAAAVFQAPPPSYETSLRLNLQT